MNIFKNSKGEWEFKTLPKDFNPIYKDSLLSYINSFSSLFDKAKVKSEFEFILTLLRFRGLQDPGWDPWENTIKTFDSLMRLLKIIKEFETKRHLSLWLYCHIVEASEPYEIIANLINIIDDGRFKISNFPDKKRGNYEIPQYPSEKINKLIKMSEKINMSDSVFPFIDIFDRELRNAISHSDYSLYKGEVRINKKDPKIYNHDKIETLINKAIAYFDAIKFLIHIHIQNYKTPKVIPVSPEFSKDPKEKAITIIRKDYGLVGIRDNWNKEELNRGCIPFRIGRFHRYELDLLNNNPFLTILPKDKIKRINNILKILPKFISRYIVKKLQDKF